MYRFLIDAVMDNLEDDMNSYECNDRGHEFSLTEQQEDELFQLICPMCESNQVTGTPTE